MAFCRHLWWVLALIETSTPASLVAALLPVPRRAPSRQDAAAVDAAVEDLPQQVSRLTPSAAEAQVPESPVWQPTPKRRLPGGGHSGAKSMSYGSAALAVEDAGAAGGGHSGAKSTSYESAALAMEGAGAPGAGGSPAAEALAMPVQLVQRLWSEMSVRKPIPKSHRVEHIGLLNNTRFWWLMGALVIAVGIAVVRMEVEGEGSDKKGSENRDSSGHTIMELLHLMSCAIALNVSMLIWGVGQEFVMTNLYTDSFGNQENVPSTLCVVLCNRVVCVLFSGLLISLHGRWFRLPGIHVAGLPAVSNLLASWCQYQSLDYISFTLQTTVKSAKILPVVLLSSLRGKKHTLQDYAEVLIIAASLVIFGLETEGKQSNGQRSTELGILLLGGLLCFDSLTPHFQDYLFKSQPHLNPLQATFAMSSIASIVALSMLVMTGQFAVCMRFITRYPESLLQMAVLSLASTLTQFLISHTIKHFGPVVFTLIATTRQAVSVCISASFFKHKISAMAVVSAVLLFSTVVVRALRSWIGSPVRPEDNRNSRIGRSGGAEAVLNYNALENDTIPELLRTTSGSFLRVMQKCSHSSQLLICAVGVHVLFGFYAMMQEFISIHTFTGRLFTYPLFLIAVNRTTGAIMAFLILKVQGLPAFDPKIRWTLLPAAPNFLATVPQYAALYRLYFPAQTLMKSLKVLPVMCVGCLLKNRTYTRLDYAEGALITALVALFVWDFQLHKGSLHNRNHQHMLKDSAGEVAIGGLLMGCYIMADSLTSNLEDYIYQNVRIDPAQQTFGIEVFSGIVAWTLLLATGDAVQGVRFLIENPMVLQYVGLLAISSALGTYASTVTVRLFGPAVFTLLMVSRQLISLVISVLVFQHHVDWLCCLCLVSVSMLILSASVRHVSNQWAQEEARQQEKAMREKARLPKGWIPSEGALDEPAGCHSPIANVS